MGGGEAWDDREIIGFTDGEGYRERDIGRGEWLYGGFTVCIYIDRDMVEGGVINSLYSL